MSKLNLRPWNSHRTVAFSYILAFGMVALGVVSMYLSVHWMMKRQHRHVELVHASGHQRTLSQRIAFASQQLVNANKKEERVAARDRLLKARIRFFDSHRQLLMGNRANFNNGKLSDELYAAYFSGDHAIDALSTKFLNAVDQLISLDADDAQTKTIANQIASLANGKLLLALDEVTRLHEANSSIGLFRVRQWESLLFIVTLIALVFEAVYIFQPIMRANEKIDKAANMDPLTELPNRRRLAQQARVALFQSQNNGNSIGFMHLDLDRFKAVNDTMGHGAGDQVLRHVAKVLRQNLRPEQLIARIGGDEFAVLFTNIKYVDDMIGPAKRLIATLGQPISIADKKCTIGCSIGLAISSKDEFDYERVLMDADIALYEAKKNGRNRYQVITDDLRGQFERKEQVTKEIRDGIERSEFTPYFQPQFDTITGEIIGVEALARWIKSDGVFEKNAEFIQVADEIGLLSEIDDQIVRKALAAFVEWREIGLQIPKISLNISVLQLESPDFVENLAATVAGYQLSPQDVSIEILESVFLDNDNTVAVENINRLAEMGFTVELDDFGTGHAAIISLLDLAVDRIKLDRSLIRDIENVGPGQTVTRTLIQLARELNIDTLAEGVETKSQAEQLAEMGCRQHQGYLYAKPMSRDELMEWIRQIDFEPAFVSAD